MHKMPLAAVSAHGVPHASLVYCRNIISGIAHVATDNRLSLGHSNPQLGDEIIFNVHKFMTGEAEFGTGEKQVQ
jgi:hypothetical protein